jgi:hypothetical protein
MYEVAIVDLLTESHGVRTCSSLIIRATSLQVRMIVA